MVIAVQSVADILSDAGIRVKSMRPGATSHVLCPKCEGGRSREISLSVTVDAEGDGCTWVCHRATCGWKDGRKVGSTSTNPNWRIQPRSAPPPVVKPRPHTSEQRSRPQWMWDFFGAREIGARTIDAFGCYVTPMWFPQTGKTHDAIVFPYLFRGELVNRKYRNAEKDFTQDKDAQHTLFNVDRLGDAPEEICFVEGEADVLALFECGIENAVTLKDGAPPKAKFDENDRRFEALRTHGDLLNQKSLKKIILAGDADAPGMALREELIRRLGRHRVWLATWPDGCKDACEVLAQHGPDAVISAIQQAEPYPIEGLQQVSIGTLLRLRHQNPPRTMTTGVPTTDAILALPTEGRLIVVTGFPGSGKSSWLRFVMMHTAMQHGRRWLVFSPEMQPWEHFAADCAAVLAGKSFWRGMSDTEITESEVWLRDRVIMQVCDAEDKSPTVDWLLEGATNAVLRHGITDVLWDPYNEITHTRGETSETDYIGRVLQQAKAFGLRHGVNVWIIAHPTKPQPLKPGEGRKPPGPYDISGSSNWFNKADLGLTVHAPETGIADVHIWKARFQRFGNRNAFATLTYDRDTGRYGVPDAGRVLGETTERRYP
jgi:twinkle protein